MRWTPKLKPYNKETPWIFFCPVLAYIWKIVLLFGGYRLSFFWELWYYKDKYMRMEHCWNDTDSGKPKCYGKTLCRCQFDRPVMPDTEWTRIATEFSAVRNRRLRAWAMARLLRIEESKNTLLFPKEHWEAPVFARLPFCWKKKKYIWGWLRRIDGIILTRETELLGEKCAVVPLCSS